MIASNEGFVWRCVVAVEGKPARNNLIRVLSKEFTRRLDRVRVERGAVLATAGGSFIYFPEDAVISVLGGGPDRQTIELWSVGHEGFVGVTGLSGTSMLRAAMVQYAGEVCVIPAGEFRRQVALGTRFNSAVMAYYARLIVQAAQVGLCNSMHSVEQRFCRWLSLAYARTGTRRAEFSHRFIAKMLGTRRASVSEAAASFQKAGIIEYRAGVIRILSPRRLIAASCSCYKTIHECCLAPVS